MATPDDHTEKNFKRVAYRLPHKFQDMDLRVHRVVLPLWNIPPFLTGVREQVDMKIEFSPSGVTALFGDITHARKEQRSRVDFTKYFPEEVASEL